MEILISNGFTKIIASIDGEDFDCECKSNDYDGLYLVKTGTSELLNRWNIDKVTVFYEIESDITIGDKIIYDVPISVDNVRSYLAVGKYLCVYVSGYKRHIGTLEIHSRVVIMDNKFSFDVKDYLILSAVRIE